MAAALGRDLAFTWKGSAIQGLREKKVNFQDNPIDITSGEDAGKKVLLAASGEDSIEISFTGVTKSKTLRDDWNSGAASRQGALAVTWADGSTLTGTFQMSNYKEGHNYKEASTFEVTFMSAAADFVYTPGV